MVNKWIPRTIEKKITSLVHSKKSILLLGPRQTGKTSLLELGRQKFDIEIQLLSARQRLRYEKDPDTLIDEVTAFTKKNKKTPLIFIDEIQKVPTLLDVIQLLIDKKMALFLLTGSSARKLKYHAHEINFLPGRVQLLRLDPLSLVEHADIRLEELLLFGSLPGVVLIENLKEKEELLSSYVETYLEEEVRKEALVRRLDRFARFLELAAIDSGKISNFSEISQQLGVAHTTVASHYQILEDCLIVERIEPITQSLNRKKLTKSPKYIFFDLGVRRLAAQEGDKLDPERMGHLFEQWVGLEFIRHSRQQSGTKVRYWRDADGPEVDWIFQNGNKWIPLEVKWSERPSSSSARNLETFIKEYPKFANRGYVICRCPQRLTLSKNVDAIPWNKLHEIL